MPPKFVWGFLSIFLVVGLVLLIYGGHLLIKSAQSASWPSAEGVVKTAEMGRHTGDKSTTYSAEVTYEYTVDGKPFTGNKIRMVQVNNSDSSYASEDLSNYAVGTKVKVYYSPSDSKDCVLEPGVHASSWLLPLMGCAFIGFPMLMMCLVLFQKKKKSTPIDDNGPVGQYFQ
jgi:hypothetical protein